MPAATQKYTYAQLEALWIQAGGDRASAPVMAAIAMAESGGNPAAINTNTNGSTDRGLWQINSVHGSLSTFDPLANAQAAVKIKKTQGLNAWVTYTSGKYRQFLQNGVSPSGTPVGSTSTTSATDASLTGDIGGAIGQGLGDAFKALMQPVISTFIWGGEIMLGIGLMVGGIIVFVINTNAGKTVTGDLVQGATAVTAPELTMEQQIQRRHQMAVKQAAIREEVKKRQQGQKQNLGNEKGILTNPKTGKKHDITVA